MSTSKETRETAPLKPVICVCDNNGIVGITTRTLYDDASLLHWRSVQNGTKPHMPFKSELHTGRLIRPSRVFVFAKHSPEHYLLAKRCFVERAIFSLPDEYDTTKDDETFEEATRWILGRPMRSADLMHELYFGSIPPDQDTPMDLRIEGFDPWMNALPETVDTDLKGVISPIEYFQLEYWHVQRNMASPPSIEDIIVTFFVISGCRIKKMVVTDHRDPQYGTLTLLRQELPPFGKGIFRSSESGEEVAISMGSTSGALLNKRFIFHEVVLGYPPWQTP